MIALNNITKTFSTADGSFEAIKGVSLRIPKGDIFGIIGMSGAGKSTLVRCMNLLERPTSGTVEIDGHNICELQEAALRAVRRDIAMIFQGFNLLMQRNCLDNVCFPLLLAGMKKAQAREKALALLELVGLQDKARAFPAQLSGGQQQRVAIARALSTNPKVLLCDEATSALDPATTHSILELIRDINEKLKITVVIITHQMSVVESICKHVALLDGGEIMEQGEVIAIFAQPQSAAAKRFVFPDGLPDDLSKRIAGESLIRVVFSGADAAGTPLIARMAVEMGIEANITYASTRSIDAKAYGSMVLGLKGGKDTVELARAYLTKAPGVSVEEVSTDVH